MNAKRTKKILIWVFFFSIITILAASFVGLRAGLLIINDNKIKNHGNYALGTAMFNAKTEDNLEQTYITPKCFK